MSDENPFESIIRESEAAAKVKPAPPTPVPPAGAEPDMPTTALAAETPTKAISAERPTKILPGDRPTQTLAGDMPTMALSDSAAGVEQAAAAKQIADDVVFGATYFPTAKLSASAHMTRPAEAPADAPSGGHSTRRGSKLQVSQELITKHFKEAQQIKDLPVKNWDRYLFSAFLGEGGMGRVYKAYDPLLNRHVALKFIRGDDAELNQRFIQEAQAQARVDHPNICKVYEVGEVEDKLFIAMQYIEGDTLSKAKKQMNLEQKINVLKDICEGVHAAHRIGLIHRDLKPANVMMEKDSDGQWHPYVMDFGLARDVEGGSGMTQSGMIMGTPWYMAPEQARGESSSLDRRTDVYSLGATIYDVLVGRPPFEGASGLDVLMKVIEEEPPALRSIDPAMPVDLETVVMKSLEKERERRYDSARALAVDLQHFLDDEPIDARKASWTYRLGKRARKQKALFTLAAASLVAVVGLASWGIYNIFQGRRLATASGEFGQLSQQVESNLRIAYLLPLHNTNADKKKSWDDITKLGSGIRSVGPIAEGPGWHAAGKAYMALHDYTRANTLLDAAYNKKGYRKADVAYSLGRTLGELYQKELDKAQRIDDPERRQSRIDEIRRQFRAPAVKYLAASVSANETLNPSVIYAGALLDYYEGRGDQALAGAEKALAEEPALYEAEKLKAAVNREKGFEYLNEGKLPEATRSLMMARESYERAATMARSDSTIYSGLARVWTEVMRMDMGQGKDAQPAFKEAVAAGERALAADPAQFDAMDEIAFANLRWAEHLMDQGQSPAAFLDAAAARARASIRVAPRSEVGHRMLGQANYLRGGLLAMSGEDPAKPWGEAVAAFEASLKQDPKSADTYITLGNVYGAAASMDMQFGRDPMAASQKAIASFEKAAELDPRTPEPHVNLGWLYRGQAYEALMGGADPNPIANKAIASLDKALSINPNFPPAYMFLGIANSIKAEHAIAHGADARELLGVARKNYSKALELDPDFHDVLLNTGEAHRLEGRYLFLRGGDPRPALREAVSWSERAAGKNPQMFEAYSNTAVARAQLAELEIGSGDSARAAAQAADSARKALSLNPDFPDAHIALARAQLAAARARAGRGSAAAELAEVHKAAAAALAINPGASDAHLAGAEADLLEAQSLTRTGKPAAAALDRAKAALAAAAEANPGDATIGLRLAELSLRRAEAGGADAAASIEAGLAAAKKAFAANANLTEATALEGALRVTAAATASEAGRSGAAKQAEELLGKAISANARLASGYGSYLEKARLLAGAPPTATEQEKN